MKESTRNFYQEAVRAAVTRIGARLDEALDLTELAAIAGLSPLHFHRIFRGMLGETPLELHRRLRLERAALQLATTEAGVTVIAFDAGFETHESFTRAFQAAYAMSPSHFRKRMAEHRAEMNYPEKFPFGLAARNGVHFDQAGWITDIVFASGDIDMDVIIEDRSAVRLAAVTHIGPRNMVGAAFGKLAQIAGPAGLLAKPDAMMVAVFLDDADMVPAAELRTSAGVVIADDCAIPDGLNEVRIEAGKYARATHLGGYSGLPDAWDRLMGQWLPASGQRVADRLSYEAYRVADHAKPDALETDLYVAIV